MPKDDSATDRELLEAARAGDPEAFETLYYRHRDWVVRLAFRFTGNRDDALDALQETFAYLLKKLPRLHLSARLTTFLYPVVKHCALDAIRKTRRHVSTTGWAQDVADPATSPDRAPRDDLAAALSSLTSDQRETLLMRYVDDLSLSEIADALAIPLGTVKSRIHNALQTLRQDERARRYFEP